MRHYPILRQLLNNELSVADLKLALSDFAKIESAIKIMVDAKVDVSFSVNEKGHSPAVMMVATHLKLNADSVATFLEMNAPEGHAYSRNESNAYGGSGDYRKIPLIKRFRETFGEGLANSKWAVETLYQGWSNMDGYPRIG